MLASVCLPICMQVGKDGERKILTPAEMYPLWALFNLSEKEQTYDHVGLQWIYDTPRAMRGMNRVVPPAMLYKQ